jgi:hypothetical protein
VGIAAAAEEGASNKLSWRSAPVLNDRGGASLLHSAGARIRFLNRRHPTDWPRVQRLDEPSDLRIGEARAARTGRTSSEEAQEAPIAPGSSASIAIAIITA